jgi:hypothetical protein
MLKSKPTAVMFCGLVKTSVFVVASGWDELKQHDVLFLMGGSCYLTTGFQKACTGVRTLCSG